MIPIIQHFKCQSYYHPLVIQASPQIRNIPVLIILQLQTQKKHGKIVVRFPEMPQKSLFHDISELIQALDSFNSRDSMIRKEHSL